MGVKGLVTQRKILGYVFLVPILTLLSVFMFYPILNSMIMSLTSWSGLTRETWYSVLQSSFVGFENYRNLLTVDTLDRFEFWRGMWVSVRFAFISTVIQTILGFFLAVFVINLSKGWQNFYKVSLYLPVILPSAVIAILWRFIYTPDFGMLNQFLRAVGLGSLTRAWIASPTFALPAVILTNTWRYVGFTTVLYYVAMLNIPADMIESSMIDGCTHLQRVRYFYFPLTRGATEINFVLSITGGLRAFDMFYLLTRGGPGTATRVVGMKIFDTAFINFRFGPALAMSVILFLVVVIVLLITRFVLAPRDDH